MERKTRIWIGLGTAVLVGGSGADRPATAAGLQIASRPERQQAEVSRPEAVRPEWLIPVQAESGEGGPNEGGGSVLGTITEFRLSSSDPVAFAYDASAQAAAYAALVHDSYARALGDATALQAAMQALLDAPGDDTLAAARAAWGAARVSYLHTEAFLFYAGPVDGPGGPLPRLNTWPVDPAVIDAIIADPAQPLGFRALAQLNQKAGPTAVTAGLHVMEYLLWGQDGTLEPGAFAAGAGDRRRDYLTAVAQLYRNDIGTLEAAWAPDANNYRAAVTKMDQRNALGRAFNGMTVLLAYELPLRRIGAGLFPANTGFEPSPFSQTSDQDFRASFDGGRSVYFDSGLDELVAATDPDLATAVADSFTRADAALAALDAPFDRFLAPPAGSPERAEAEMAVRSLTDLGRELRRAGNRLGVLVVVPGL